MKKNTILFMILGVLASFALYANSDKKSHGHEGKPGDRMMEMLDTNKDGKISKEEWSAHFDAIDMNKDGFLSKEELDKHHEMNRDKMHEHMHDSMKKEKK
ncbi:MAG: hypothetical protein OEV66_05605 [Spirochaetia bacterium]|nr:hypothetical protein [Spirochaetia bacterium]